MIPTGNVGQAFVREKTRLIETFNQKRKLTATRLTVLDAQHDLQNSTAISKSGL